MQLKKNIRLFIINVIKKFLQSSSNTICDTFNKVSLNKFIDLMVLKYLLLNFIVNSIICITMNAIGNLSDKTKKEILKKSIKINLVTMYLFFIYNLIQIF